MNIDIGGQKARNDMGGKWKIVDCTRKSKNPIGQTDYVVNLNKENLPFKDNKIDNIYSSHTLEHIEPIALPNVFKEMYRVLKPKIGKIRIVVPDCEKAVRWYLKKPEMLKGISLPSKKRNIPDTKMGYLTCWFATPGRGHKIGFDYELILAYMKNASFRKITRKKFNSCSKIFNGKDMGRYENFSIYVEAIK